MQGFKKAIFIDIDGTLILGDCGPFLEDIQEIKEARRQGHKVFLNTGRSLGNIPQNLRETDYIDGVVAGCGSNIILNGKVIYRKFIDKALLPEICNFYLKNGRACVFEAEKNVYGINIFKSSLFYNHVVQITSLEDLNKNMKDDAATKLTIEGQITCSEEKMLGDVFQLNQFPDYFEGIIKGESKQKGMQLILKEEGISIENCIAIGDSVNDMDALDFAGVAIAMGNASEKLKAIADYITTDCGAGGVGNAIKKWVLNS